MEENNEKIKIMAHNGAIIEVNTNKKTCKNFSGFEPMDTIIKGHRLAIFVGIGENPLTGQIEAWKFEPKDGGITSTNCKKWEKINSEKIKELLESGTFEEIPIIMAANF